MRSFSIHLHCPYYINGKPCKGETLADGRSKTSISVTCGKCGRVYIADLDTMKTWPAKPQRHQGRR